MNTSNLTFTANDQELAKNSGMDEYASNTVSYIKATFTLGTNWSGFDSVRAVWSSYYNVISTVLDTNNSCMVPAEMLLHKSKVQVNLVGSIVEGGVLTDRLTTFPVEALKVSADAKVSGSETAPVTPSQFEQFVDSVEAAAQSVTDYSYDSEAWAKGTRGGTAVSSSDPTYHNNSKYWNDQGAALSQEVTNLKSEISPSLGKFDTTAKIDFSVGSNGHSSNADKLSVNVKAGQQIVVKCELSSGTATNCAIYLNRADGTSRSISGMTGTEYLRVPDIDIDSVGVYIGGQSPTVTATVTAVYSGVAETEIKDLKENFQLADSGTLTIRDFATWSQGGLSGGQPNLAAMYRLVSLTAIKFDEDTPLYIQAGRRVSIHLLNDDESLKQDLGWQTGSYTIPANTKFRMLISGTSSTTTAEQSLVPTVDEFTSWITLDTKTGKKVDLIEPIKEKAGLTKSTQFTLNAGAGHSSNSDRISIDIPQGSSYSVLVKLSTGEALANNVFYAKYKGSSSTTAVQNGIGGIKYVLTADADIESIGVYMSGASATATVTLEVSVIGEVEELVMSDTLFNANYHQEPYDYLTYASRFSALMNGTENVESFLFFTDPHLARGTDWHKQFRNYLSQIQKVYNSVPANFCLCGGDWLGNNDTVAEACFKMGYCLSNCRAMFEPFYWMVGNHDTNYQGTERLSADTLNNLMFPYSTKNYYTFDGKRTRFYVFDTWVEMEHTSYETSQAEWFANALLTDNSAHIAITAHILYYNSDHILETLTDQILSIAEAYNNRTSITFQDITYDYSSATGKVEFALFGHLHDDVTAVVHGIPCIATTWVLASNSIATFDLMLVDYDNRVIKCVRIGEGSDRTVSLA